VAKDIRSLTALRGIAALMVLGYHSANLLFGGFEHVPPPMSHGNLAVDLFFLLSGFILMHVHQREFADGVRWANVKSFLRARFARTYPVHLAVLLVLVPLYSARPNAGLGFVHSLLLTQGVWLDAPTWNVPAWSISAEWHAYLLFPFLVMPWQGRSLRVVGAVLLLCVATVGVLAMTADGNVGTIYYGPAVLLRVLPEFIAGMGIYRVYQNGLLRSRLSGDAALAIAATAVIALALFNGTDIAVIAALAVVLLACAHNQGIASRVLTHRVPMYLGRISYSLYMVQTVAAEAALRIVHPSPAEYFGGSATLAGAMFLSSFAIAVPLSRYIEYPVRDLLRGRVSTYAGRHLPTGSSR
jgi:peptidoglycan/LPS O-acetylase OafA/YrhL